MKILNAKGEPIVLNEREKRIALYNQQIVNALGVEIDITTLTSISKKISEQKFYDVEFAEYVPTLVGNGAWSTNLTTYRSFSLAESFETGLINMGSENGRLASANAGVDSVTVPVNNWAKEVTWSLFELEYAAKSGNWDLVSSLEKARKKNWDLGLQQLAFLGLTSVAAVKGLLTQSNVTVNTSLITIPISTMTAAQLSTLVAGLYEAYRSNCNRSAKPTAFVIPESDYNGLASQASPDFPIKTKLELLEQALQAVTMNKSFKVMPVSYADAANSLGLLAKPRYTLLNQDEESVRMDIPVNYTSTVANSINNFSFQNVGYGQCTGVKAYRELEMLYIDNNT